MKNFIGEKGYEKNLSRGNISLIQSFLAANTSKELYPFDV